MLLALNLNHAPKVAQYDAMSEASAYSPLAVMLETALGGVTFPNM